MYSSILALVFLLRIVKNLSFADCVVFVTSEKTNKTDEKRKLIGSGLN